MKGNEHFRLGEWAVALRRYKRAIYFCAFDEMQMADLMDHHKEQVHQNEAFLEIPQPRRRPILLFCTSLTGRCSAHLKVRIARSAPQG